MSTLPTDSLEVASLVFQGKKKSAIPVLRPKVLAFIVRDMETSPKDIEVVQKFLLTEKFTHYVYFCLKTFSIFLC